MVKDPAHPSGPPFHARQRSKLSIGRHLSGRDLFHQGKDLQDPCFVHTLSPKEKVPELAFRDPVLCFRNQPLMEPIMTPLTKYFCTKGYTQRIGRVAKMMVEYWSSFLYLEKLPASVARSKS